MFIIGFSFGSLPPHAVILDVGAGVGSASMPILKAYPELDLKLVVQDRPSVVANGIEVSNQSFEW